MWDDPFLLANDIYWFRRVFTLLTVSLEVDFHFRWFFWKGLLTTYIHFSRDTLAKMLRNALRFVEEMLSRCYCSYYWFLTILCCIVGSRRLSRRCSTKAQYASKHRAGQCKNASHRECALRWPVIWWAVTTEMEAWLSDYMTADTEYLWGGFHKDFSDVLFEPPVPVLWIMTRDYSWATITLLFAAVFNTHLETRKTIDTLERHQTKVHGKTIWVPPNTKLLLYARISYHAHLILSWTIFHPRIFCRFRRFFSLGPKHMQTEVDLLASASSKRFFWFEHSKLVEDPSPFADWNCIYSYFFCWTYIM